MSKRFIAGAVCPQCQAMDRVVLIQSEEGDRMECVACGHSEERPSAEEVVKGNDLLEGTQVIELRGGEKSE